MAAADAMILIKVLHQLLAFGDAMIPIKGLHKLVAFEDAIHPIEGLHKLVTLAFISVTFPVFENKLVRKLTPSPQHHQNTYLSFL